jgi:acetyltransferase-like isoleucine patch superfamily enzyme
MTGPGIQRSLLARLRAHWEWYGLFGGMWLGLRFVYCRFYQLRFRKCGSFFIRGPFLIQGAKYISIGTLRAGDRISIDAVDRYLTQSFKPTITIGNGVCFSNDIHIGCTHSVTLGDGVLLGSHVFISDHDHGIYSGETPHSAPDEPPSLRSLTSDGTVVIEDNVHIGEYVTVLKNVRIGAGSVIGSQSVVTRDIPPYTIAAGSPARPIKRFCHTSQRWLNSDEVS